MRLQISKGHIDLIGTSSDGSLIDDTATEMMEIDTDLDIVSGGDEDGEYWITLAYDSRYLTIAEVKEIYKRAKDAQSL